MIEDAYPLAALQAGMIYHSELEPGGPTYHDLMTITLRGAPDVPALTGALTGVAARHPVLRTSFDLTGFSEPLQLVHDTATIPLEVVDLRPDGDGPDGDGPGSGWRRGGRPRSTSGSTGRHLRCCGRTRTCWTTTSSR